MSSSTPADSDAQGISSPETDSTSAEEYTLSASPDSNDQKFSSDPVLVLEELDRESPLTSAFDLNLFLFG